ncbi:MAG TPA: hypothetical protein VIK97_07320 [Casimicrobiaceae bacterium]
MNDDFNIDPDVFAACVRDGERMRAELLRELLGTWWKALRRLGVRAKGLFGANGRAKALNMSVPAPHHGRGALAGDSTGPIRPRVCAAAGL